MSRVIQIDKIVKGRTKMILSKGSAKETELAVVL